MLNLDLEFTKDAATSRFLEVTPRVQVPNNHILSKNPNLHNYYPNTEYLIIGSFGPLGLG